MTERGWGRRFEDPIRIGDRVLVTLLDAGEYIVARPEERARRTGVASGDGSLDPGR